MDEAARRRFERWQLESLAGGEQAKAQEPKPKPDPYQYALQQQGRRKMLGLPD